MITGEINEKVVPYRQKEGLNFSSIKTFDSKGAGIFYKEYILGQKEDSDSPALIVGNLVDDMVLTYGGDMNEFYQHFDEKYCKFDGVKSTAQAFVLADVLFTNLMETVNSEGKITGDFETCFKQSFDIVQAQEKYKGKTWEKGLEDFEKVARQYFDSKIKNIGKIVVDLKTLNVAENVAKVLLTDDFTRGIFKSEDKMFIPKVVVEFTYLGIKCKAELDAVEVDHVACTVQGVDLKTTFDNESFDYMYIKNSYYLQQAFYTEALKQWMKDNDLTDYDLLPFKFIVADTSANNRRPLIYNLSSEDMKVGFTGFTMKGNQYKGINQLVTDIKWHMDNEVWNCSREALQTNGNLKLSINYENK